LKRGEMGSDSITMALIESGMATRKMPPKKSQARSKPSITAARLCSKVSQQYM
jgi:hypothetical protein